MKRRTVVFILAAAALLLSAALVSAPLREENRAAQYQKALSFYESQDYDAAYRMFHRLRNWKQEAEAYAHVCRARLYLASGEPDRAVGELVFVRTLRWPARLEEAVRSVDRDIAVALRNPAFLPSSDSGGETVLCG